MENDREVDSVLMNVKSTTGGVVSALTFSARVTWKILSTIMRLAKKGLVSGGICDQFKNFHTVTGGEYTTYNIPLSEEKAKMVKELQGLELQLEQETNPFTKAGIKRKISSVEKSIPEIQQLKKLGISHCVLPKLNGSKNTIQVAIANKDTQNFKTWFLNHITSNMTGGEKSLETLNVFTEGNYSVLNMPFEEAKDLGIMLSDFGKMKINYSILPDLNVGDGYTQVAIANADRTKVENWFKMWKQKLMSDGEETKEMYEINSDTYTNTAELSAEDYINQADNIYQEANQEFTENEKDVPWKAKLSRDNSPEFVKLSQDDNYEKITINVERLVDYRKRTEGVEALENKGFFLSRLPGRTRENEKQLVLPRDKAFITDRGETVVAFLDKREDLLILNIGSRAKEGGETERLPFTEVKKIYDKVERGFKQTAALAKTPTLTQNPIQNMSPSKPIIS